MVLNFDEVKTKTEERNLTLEVVYRMANYLENIRLKPDDKSKTRLRVRFKKMTDETFDKYWQTLKELLC